jgi:hypothetical protein
MNLIIKINKQQVWEFDVSPTDEFSIELKQSSSAKSRKVFEKEIAYFETFRKAYPGVKRGLETEFNNFIKKNKKDWVVELPKLYAAVLLEIEDKKKRKFRGEFVPQWKNLQTWINNRCWEIEYETKTTPILNDRFLGMAVVNFKTE